jgi:OmpR-family two-component system manganese-sensing sensor histidine kinase
MMVNSLRWQMSHSLRWQIATYFVALSAIVYITSTFLGLIFFSTSLTAALDEELAVFASEVGHAIELQNDRPHFRDWARKVETQPARSIASIQIFDAAGNMIDHYGPPGMPQLILRSKEMKSGAFIMRVKTGPLKKDGKLVGYLQIQLPTNGRDSAIYQYCLTTALFAPVVLISLVLISYFVSGKVARPTQETLRTLRNFVADAGHELNTPLTIIQVQIESLARKLKKQSIDEKESTVITSAVSRMSLIVNDLMLLSEIEGALKQSDHNNFDLSKLLTEITDEYREQFSRKELTMVVSLADDLRVDGNAEAMSHVFGNLLENACRYTPAGGTVTITAVSNGRLVTVSIADTGIGIPAESLPFIFDRFYRVDPSRSRESGGVGLGLAIAKAIVDNHHGKIEIQSELEKGSKFSITLPASRSDKV